MSERRRNAPTQRLTRRRDDDPVKISKDHRVSWYPSGVPGKGERKQKRCRTDEEAELSRSRSAKRSIGTGLAGP